MKLPSHEEILEDLEFLDDWENRYEYIIDLGKALPALSPEQRLDIYKVKGCQSDVWLISKNNDGKLEFSVDSDAMIVKGLLGLVMSVYNQRTPSEILAFDIDQYFQTLDLEQHISPTRGNGLRAIVAKIRAHAEAAA
ncbi:SufE family protein [Aliidiomarina sp.]|uniref:SufE family protein n=1 Tax=Aliidiomarina sp. TaxID=1872439 RepID=UPI003A4D339D